MPKLTVVEPGALTTVQDFGRSGLGDQGVPRSGAADLRSMRLANRLVGNPENGAVLETTLLGPTLRAHDDLVLAVTGARCTVYVDGRPDGQDTALRLRAGQTLSIGQAIHGLRSYLAVRGGVQVEPVLGSRSFDTLGRIGPRPLQAGDEVIAGAPDGSARPPCFEVVPSRLWSTPPVLNVVSGWRNEWFPPSAMRTLLTSRWTVGGNSNRVGVRFEGEPIARRSGEVPSEGMLAGAIQVPESGMPIVLGRDCGTTGGYPVLAVVIAPDLDVLGQLRPGDQVTLRLHRP
jgi:biotin-dependent carboxylase-like uncharacterized protein